MISRLGGGSADMMRRSLLTSLFVLIATASLAAPPPVNPADAAAFMNQLWASAVEVLNKKADPAAREARFRQLFHEDFDCPGIARFVLGRYWRSASEEEQQEFVRLFEDYVVFVYTARLGDFGGETRFGAAEATATGSSFRLTSSARAAPHRSGSIGGW
jgi:phospholipid transport system substrate-binding protein